MQQQRCFVFNPSLTGNLAKSIFLFTAVAQGSCCKYSKSYTHKHSFLRTDQYSYSWLPATKPFHHWWVLKCSLTQVVVLSFNLTFTYLLLVNTFQANWCKSQSFLSQKHITDVILTKSGKICFVGEQGYPILLRYKLTTPVSFTLKSG